MKKIIGTFMLFIMMLGLIATIATPIYLLITASCLKTILPQWYIIINIIISIFDLLLIVMIFMTWIFDDKKQK